MKRSFLAPAVLLATFVLVAPGSQATPPAPAPLAAAPDISVANVQAHLNQLQSIATANGGNRAAGRPGYQASLNWVKGKLDAAGYTTSVQTFSTSAGYDVQPVADWPGGDPDHVVMTGAHLDTSPRAPASTTTAPARPAILENALAFAASGITPRNHLRFGCWGAEELGLLGSKHYMSTLPAAEKDKIELYLNFDMIGSPNPGYFVYNDNPAGNGARDDLTSYFTSKGIAWEYIDVQGRSDHAAFRSYGHPDVRHVHRRREHEDLGAGAEVGRPGRPRLRPLLPRGLRHHGQRQRHRARPQHRRHRAHALEVRRRRLRHHAAAHRRQPARQRGLRVGCRVVERHHRRDHVLVVEARARRDVEGVARRQRQPRRPRASPRPSPSRRPRRRPTCPTGSAPTPPRAARPSTTR